MLRIKKNEQIHLVGRNPRVLPTRIRSRQPHPHSIQPSPDNRHIFATNLGSDLVLAFRFDAAPGRPTAVGNAATEKQPRGFNIDPTGRYLAAVGELSNGMSVYAIDPLKWLKSYKTGKQPNWVEFVSFQ